jgi:hypothetical protein
MGFWGLRSSQGASLRKPAAFDAERLRRTPGSLVNLKILLSAFGKSPTAEILRDLRPNFSWELPIVPTMARNWSIGLQTDLTPRRSKVHRGSCLRPRPIRVPWRQKGWLSAWPPTTAVEEEAGGSKRAPWSGPKRPATRSSILIGQTTPPRQSSSFGSSGALKAQTSMCT